MDYDTSWAPYVDVRQEKRASSGYFCAHSTVSGNLVSQLLIVVGFSNTCVSKFVAVPLWRATWKLASSYTSMTLQHSVSSHIVTGQTVHCCVFVVVFRIDLSTILD